MKNLIGKICILKANSPAIHKMGDIQREYDDLFYIEKDLGDEWKGNFIFGYGFIGVKVKKADIRVLTKEEWKKKFEGTLCQISNQPPTMFQKKEFYIEEK